MTAKQKFKLIFCTVLIGLIVSCCFVTIVVAQTPFSVTESNVTIEILNDPSINSIIAYNDSASTLEGIAIYINVPQNDKPLNSTLDLNSVSIVTESPNGSSQIINGQVKFTPSPGYIGTTQLTYEICNAQGVCDQALVTIVVTARVHGIKANADSVTIEQDQSIEINVIGNDELTNSNFEFSKLTIVSTSPNGTTQVVNNKILFTPNVGYSGTTQFTYRICNTDGDCDQAVVTILVKPKPAPQLPGDTPITGGVSLLPIGVATSILTIYIIIWVDSRQRRKRSELQYSTDQKDNNLNSDKTP